MRSGDFVGDGDVGWFAVPEEMDGLSARLLLDGGMAGAGPLREDIVLLVT